MEKRLQTIYEYFKGYTKEEIDKVLSSLSEEEKRIITLRYGTDLCNPTTSPEWTLETSKKFYSNLVPKLKRLLNKAKDSINGQDNETIKKIFNEESNNVTIDYSDLIYRLIIEEKTNHEICEILEISNEQLYQELLKLKNKGISFSRKYYSDAHISYNGCATISQLKNLINDQDRIIITKPNENNLKILVISDLHFGNSKERIDLINRAYNYCIKNNINLILCGGDLIDGTYSHEPQKLSNPHDQVEHFIKNYPSDPSIITFGVAGDHDISALHDSYINIIDACQNYRHDIVIGGYNNSLIYLKNDAIHMYHHINQGFIRQTAAPIILHGHSHKFTTEVRNNALQITLPSLSDITKSIPTVLELNITFLNGLIKYTNVKQIYFADKDYVLSESDFSTSYGRDFTNQQIRNVESFSHQLPQIITTPITEEPIASKKLVRENRPLTQTEKFYRRFGDTLNLKR